MRICLVLLLLGIAKPVVAQKSDATTPVIHGLELLQRDSAEAAVAVWASAWTGSVDAGKASQLSGSLLQFGAVAGHMRAYDILKVEQIGPHIRLVSVLMRYENVPMYAEFQVYDRGVNTPDWMIAKVTWNTDPEKVLPSTVWPRVDGSQ
jgi:hypothetical protein